MRAAAARLGAAVVLLAAAGCGGGQGADERVDRSGRGGGQSAQECSHHVDALIDDRIVPRSDRDYATEMCLQQR